MFTGVCVSLSLVKRRHFLKSAAISLPGISSLTASESSASKRKAPYRLLYSNDTTNILSCISPYHQAREPFTQAMLEASVDEAADAGTDAQLLQPGLGWVPWWKSSVYPMAEHEAWLKETYGIPLDPFAQFVRDGGDIVQVFIDRCRLKKQAASISIRLNDAHHKEWVDAKPGDKIAGSAAQTLTPFYKAHPEYRLGSDLKNWTQRIHNWAIPEVRSHKFAFIKELCENYDIDGLELDFLRNYAYFDQGKTTRDERCLIMTSFIRDVRQLLDRTQRGDKRRWLCARVPCYMTFMDPLGIDLTAMTAAGLDIVNASANYFTTQEQDIPAIRKAVPNTTVYLELCHSIANGPKVADGYDAFTFRRATPEQLRTAAHLAYADGVDGISLFNFVYYREHGSKGRGPFAEPPFETFKSLKDPEALAGDRRQHWFIASGWRTPGSPPLQIPRKLTTGKRHTFAMRLAKPQGGWQQEGRLRLQSESGMAGREFKLIFNGVELSPNQDNSIPFAGPYSVEPASLEDTMAWTVPMAVLKQGINRFDVTLTGGDTTTLSYADMTFEA